MFKISQGKSRRLTELALDFNTLLNPVKNCGAPAKRSLKARVSNAFNEERCVEKKFFYKQLVKYNYSLLNKIIVADPLHLTSLFKYFEGLVVSNKIPPFYQINRKLPVLSQFGNEVFDLFNYEYLRNSKPFKFLAEELGVQVCPYCHYCHTLKIRTAKGEKVLYDFDHFIPKAAAPYLSLSFFNLIPSCKVCNQNFKGSKIVTTEDYIHPYFDDLHSMALFSIDPPLVINNDENSFIVKTKCVTSDLIAKEKAIRSVDLFHIDTRYNEFRDEVLRLNELSKIYSESFKLELLKFGWAGRFFTDRSDLIKHLAMTLDLPSSEEKAVNHLKGKFKLDIARGFKLLE